MAPKRGPSASGGRPPAGRGVATVAAVAAVVGLVAWWLAGAASGAPAAPPASARPPAADTHANKAFDHWTGEEASDSGVLGGALITHEPDVAASLAFLRTHLPGKADDAWRRGRGLVALDCGAGVGRVSKNVLAPLGVATVDLVEPQQHMVAEARKNLAADGPAIRHVFLQSLENFTPTERYDLIVIQWVLQYISTQEVEQFMGRLRAAVAAPAANGDGDGTSDGNKTTRGPRWKKPLVFWKENYSHRGQSFVHSRDGSYTRTDEEHRAIFRRTGWKIRAEAVQTPWPDTYFPVKMYLLV